MSTPEARQQRTEEQEQKEDLGSCPSPCLTPAHARNVSQVMRRYRANVIEALQAWAEARALARLLRNARARLGRCEYAARAEPDVGDDGVPPCHLSANVKEDYCEPCASRDLLWPGYRAAHLAERKARGRVAYIIDRDWGR